MKKPNIFESGERKVIPAVLVYISREDEILMIHRNSTQRADYHSGKWNGLGGKSEKDESPWGTARREIREESGLEFQLEEFKSLGFLQFPLFKPHKNEDWLVYLFVVNLREDQLSLPLHKSDEGELHWIPKADLLKLNLWPGDELFIPYILRGEPLVGTLWYEGGKLSRAQIQSLHPDHGGSLQKF